MTAPQSHRPVVQYIDDGYVAFGGCHRAVVNGNGHQSRANAPGQRGMIYCVKCFVLCSEAKKLHAKNHEPARS